MDPVARTLAMLRPDELWPAWRWADLMERHGHMAPAGAKRWKDGVYGLMQLWGLEREAREAERGLWSDSADGQKEPKIESASRPIWS
jgi:hypothetical protein